ncbi:hypothetical protein SAMN04488021_14427 [Paracoccus aminovorans]|uniref:Uncharacterized protein n=1 Tax=Paracoccus aminovorans TaxID=34004 RepID=A0A1I3E296_9RHOB|nr:hypothetical protein [Paracoccus aminovorans]CQR84656.1 hypothetical protein JCM7685_0063 [Paracoccus aminovorans]SFH93065.1 hypothetical protein SAMN04488021_14427 [Paracoccus aminovorans]
MSIHSRFPNRSATGTHGKRALGVQQVLEWAFRTEKARLELPEPPDPERGDGLGFGLEYVLMQRAALGCRIDGGRYKPDSSTHEDAEVIAACVANLPTSLGGLRMAIRIAELARAGMTPDWMPGAVPRCVPVETKRNQHGDRSITIPVGTARVLSRGKWRTVELRACPVTFSPHPEQIAAARRHYAQWWLGLRWVREGLIAGGMLRSIEVTDTLPKREPWRASTRV